MYVLDKVKICGAVGAGGEFMSLLLPCPNLFSGSHVRSTNRCQILSYGEHYEHYVSLLLS